MANAKEIKERMASIEETRKITNAMYLISSSKMKQAKKKLADTEPFFYAMQAEIARILRHVPDMHSQFFDGRESIPAEERKIGYIVVTADKGLAGAYNHNVIKATEELLKKPGKHKLFVLGEAGRQYFAKREGIEMDTQFRYIVQISISELFFGDGRTVQKWRSGRDPHHIHTYDQCYDSGD